MIQVEGDTQAMDKGQGGGYKVCVCVFVFVFSLAGAVASWTPSLSFRIVFAESGATLLFCCFLGLMLGFAHSRFFFISLDNS